MANASVSVHEALKIGESMLLDFMLSIPDSLYVPLKNSKTMESIKRGVAFGDKTFYDMASLPSRLITVRQHGQVELQTVIDYDSLTMNCALFLHQSLMTMGV